MLKPVLFAAATLASALSATPVFAKAATPGVRVVSYADLDLSSSAGQARLEQRINAAVRDVCGEAPSFDLARLRAVKQCRIETRANVRLPERAGAGQADAR